MSLGVRDEEWADFWAWSGKQAHNWVKNGRGFMTTKIIEYKEHKEVRK